MKVALASDLHLEFGDLDFENTEGAEVLILSGDICVAHDLMPHNMNPLMDEVVQMFNIPTISDSYTRSLRYQAFFERCCARFPQVIYILGNHEHYYRDYNTTILHIKHMLSRFANLHILEQEMVTVGNVNFLGGTLWTDMNQEDPNTMSGLTTMNDFRIIFKGDRTTRFSDAEGNVLDRTARLTPEDVLVDHKRMLEYIRRMIKRRPTEKFVICGHHAPSEQSIDPVYANDRIMSAGFASNLDDFVLNYPQIKLWTHGHVHQSYDYMIGSTRILCNPRGYVGTEPRADTWRLVTVEV
jgi:Icc-related predicted phosphoesterase